MKYLLLTIILFAGFGLRVYQIGEHGLAGDEKYSLFVSQFVSYEGNNQKNSVRKPDNPYFTPKEFWSEKGISDFFDSIARIDTGNGAFYTFLLHYWSKLVGVEDGNLRFLSLIFNLLTIVLLFIFVEKHFKSVNLALLAALLATISPFYIAFSQVARNYAIQFFFSLLSTHLFLLIIEKIKEKRNPLLLIILYGLAALITELCHISTFPLFMIHGLFLLIYYRKISFLGAFTLAMIIPFIGVWAWLKSDGGKWLVDYVSNSVKVYNEMAKNNPEEFLKVATIPNIIKQSWHIISCNFITLEGLYLKIIGLKNTFFIIFSAFLACFISFFIRNDKIKIIAICLLIIAVYFVPSFQNFENIVLFFNLFLGLFLITKFIKNTSKILDPKIVLLLLLSILPFLFIAIFAYKDGNTFRIMPRYVGYGYAYGIILISLIIRYLYKLSDKIKYVFLIGGIFQIAVVFGLIKSIYGDNSPRYFMSFENPRKVNPYLSLAKKIEKNYAKGDTVIYCSTEFATGGKNMPKFSVVDAQLTNFYLPKDAEFIQRVNPKERNKVFLKKSDGKMIELFDFEGAKYRY